MPREQSKRDVYAQSVGIDNGFALLDALDSDEAPEGLRDLPVVGTWQRHYERVDAGGTGQASSSF